MGIGLYSWNNRQGREIKQINTLLCSDLAFEIANVDCATDDVIIQNNGNIDIAGVIIRPFVGTDASVVRGPGMSAFKCALSCHFSAGVTKSKPLRN